MASIVRTRIIYIAWLAVLSAFCILPSAVAQSGGAVKGKVRNMAGDSISGATITARRDAQDVKSARSGAKGEFFLDGLDAGTYNIVFDAKGYSSGIKYRVEVKPSKTHDLGDRLILQVDRGAQVIVEGSVFFQDGTSASGVEVKVEKIAADGSARKIGTVMTNISGEFSFRQPDSPAKFRFTVKYKDTIATNELEVESAAIYRTAISLPVFRSKN